ncbi:ParA family protein [Sporomusa acidovorans]|uniref:ParA family protein n=1 Tax=Sporomusa acidovorans TaxID=112900 RepID=UPI00088391E8|nr:AAA family ATPase [Sporomusa acidovorans]OZC18931.1 sporulation initiation inhibitor protein Soj [Sporomusa acidovorans DSM 3132]SDD69519.1 chromosome partitioning protein [Sporomusa acidovorans]
MEQSTGMIIICFMNLKGGVGKTTLSTHVACALAKLGIRILFIDNDKQGNASRFFQVQTENTLSEVLDDSISAAQAIQKTAYENIDIISADMGLAAVNFDIMLSDKYKNRNQKFLLKEALEPVRTQYQFCIIDNPPDINTSVYNALMVANEVIFVTTPDCYARDGMDLMYEQLQAAKSDRIAMDAGYNEFLPDCRLRFRGCVLNKYTPDSAPILESIQKKMPTFSTTIRLTKTGAKRLQEAAERGISVQALSPSCGFSRDFKHFMEELFYTQESGKL